MSLEVTSDTCVGRGSWASIFERRPARAPSRLRLLAAIVDVAEFIVRNGDGLGSIGRPAAGQAGWSREAEASGRSPLVFVPRHALEGCGSADVLQFR